MPGVGVPAVYRRFKSLDAHVTKLPDGRYRPNSGLFEDGNLELSIDDGEHASASPMATAGDDGAVAVPKRLFDELTLAIEPAPEEGNPAHCVVRGRISNGARRRLAKASRVVHTHPKIDVVDGEDAAKWFGERP